MRLHLELNNWSFLLGRMHFCSNYMTGDSSVRNAWNWRQKFWIPASSGTLSLTLTWGVYGDPQRNKWKLVLTLALFRLLKVMIWFYARNLSYRLEISPHFLMFLLKYQTLPFFFSSQFVLVNSLEVCEAISLKNERRKPRREKRRKKNLAQSTPSTLVCNSGNSTLLGLQRLEMLLLLTVTRCELLV